MTWNWKTPSLWQRLLAGLLIVGAASAFRAVFFGDLGRGIPYLVFYPATMLAALYGGLATGFLATGLSAILAFFWVQRSELSPSEWLGFIVFIVSCTAISLVCEAMRRAQKKAEAANQELQREVAERKQAEEALRTEIDARKQAQGALTRRVEELAQFNAAAVGRELRMVELKEQVNGLARQLGQPPLYEMGVLEEAVPTTAPEVEGAISRNPKSKTTNPGSAV